MVESFFKILKSVTEFPKYGSKEQAKQDLFEFIEI